MKTNLSMNNDSRSRMPQVYLILLLTVLFTTASSFASGSEKVSTPPSATVDVVLLSTPPTNGFRPGDQFQVQVTVTGVDNSTGAFRVDLLDYPILLGKTAEFTSTLSFGNNLILREAVFSHGIFLRTSIKDKKPEKAAYIAEQTLEYASNSDAYTWLIDTRFRNGTLQTSDVATLTLTLEYVVYSEMDDVTKIQPINGDDYTFYVDFTETDGTSGGSRSLDVSIDKVGYVSPQGPRYFTTKIAPSGLMAGEPYLIEIGIIKYGWAGPHYYSTDLFINQGFTPFSLNQFYASALPNTSPLHRDGAPLFFTSLSVGFGEMETHYPINPAKMTDQINQGHYNPFILTYQPSNEQFNVRSISDNCYDIYSYDDNSCDLAPIYLYANTISRLFIQGVATLEKAGSEAIIQGNLEFIDNVDKSNLTGSPNKAIDSSNPFTISASTINETFDIAAFTFVKTVSDPCFEPGDDGYFEIELSGADFRKVSSVWFVSDLVPVALSPNDILQNFIKSKPNNSSWEYGLLSKEPGGGFFYSFNNTMYPIYYPVVQITTTESVQTQNTSYDYNWYDTIWFKLPFNVEEDASPGNNTNTASFDFLTTPFTNIWIAKGISNEVQAPDDIDYLVTDKQMLEYFANFYPTYFDANMVDTSVDFTIGCAKLTVSGYKFEDHNANGQRETGDQGLEGWTITLQGAGGTFITTTDENGFFLFEGLKAGVYQLREESQDGWRQSLPAGEGFYNVSVSSDRSTAEGNFGNYRPAFVFGHKYHDLNGSGTHDEGEPPMEGVGVQLRDLSGNVIAEVLTDANGYYEFMGIDPGYYVVFEVIPEGMYQSQPGPAVGGFYHLVLTSGIEIGPKDFGNYEFTHVGVYVYYTDLAPKTAPSGLHETRTPAAGVLVSGVRTGPAPLKLAPGKTDILLPGATTFAVTTDEDGYVMVDGLLPGLYTFTVTPPDAYTYIVTQNPVGDILVSGGEVVVEFGLYYDDSAAPEVEKSSITGSVFADANGDGGWQFPAETGISGKNVSLTGTSNRGNVVHRNTTTDQSGTFVFGDLPEGRYVVSVQSVAGASVSAPFAMSHIVVLGENQNIGLPSSGAPGGSGWLQSAIAGQDVTFGTFVLVLDTDLNGVADTRIDLSGLARFELGGVIGQTERPFALMNLSMFGDGVGGQPVVAATPGLFAGNGELEGVGALVGIDMRTGLVIQIGDQYLISSDAIPFVGSADRWPVRNTTAVFNASVTGTPVVLRNPFGHIVANILYAEHTPTFGVDFAVERADFGDAPATYGTLRAVPGDPFVLTPGGIVYPLDGARHLMPWNGMPELTLGPTVTADVNGQPTEDANGDFDNGVVLPAAVAPNSAFETTMTITGTGLLSVWVDQNRNGVFESTEKLVSDEPVTTGEHIVTLHSGATATSGITFIRIRLTTQAGVGPTGLALDGEVEDYKLVIDAALAGGGGGLPTGDDGDAALPTSFALHQNYPNPFNPTTVIPYDLASTSHVRITVYDVTGRPVASLLDAQQNAGRHQVTFNAVGLPSGVYMVRLEAGGQVMVRKLTLLK